MCALHQSRLNPLNTKLWLISLPYRWVCWNIRKYGRLIQENNSRRNQQRQENENGCSLWNAVCSETQSISFWPTNDTSWTWSCWVYDSVCHLISLLQHSSRHAPFMHSSNNPTMWKSPPDYWTATRPEAWPHPLRFLFGGTCGKQEMAEYHLALKPTGMHTYTHACTSLMCTVRCLSGWQGFLSSIHLSTVTGRWQTSVSMFLSPTGESWS